MRSPGEISPFTGPGYKNTAKRLGGNGPMDDTTRKIVRFVHEFSASKMTPAATHAFNRTMIDSMASLVAGFEEEPCRIAAKVAKLFPPGALKSTVLGYGIETTPEHATFANGCLIRMVDFNDNAEGGHTSTLIPVALVFLLVGFTANLASLVAAAGQVLISIAVVFASRVIVVSGTPLLLIVLRRRVRLLRRLQPVTSRAERAVLIWGGLRGALTITLALALPPEFPERQLMIAMAFGVVLFSLLVQGVTLSLLVRRTGLAAVK